MSIYTGLLRLIQLVGEDIQHQLAVTISVDMAMGFQVQVALEFHSVNEVTVVSEADSVGAVNIERLGLRALDPAVE